MTRQSAPSAQRTGALLALLAAASFGLSAPLAKLLVAQAPPVLLAGLLYVGTGLGLSLLLLVPSRERREAPLCRGDLGLLAGVVLCGGVLGPVLMLWGLARTSGIAGALLLNLEAPLTILLAVVLFGEHLGRGAVLAAALILLGAAGLKLQAGGWSSDWLGIAAIAGACLCWAVDNNLTQRLSLRDPVALVRVKALAAGSFNLALGLLLGERLPAPSLIGSALGLGLVSYGLSVLCATYSLRLIGAAREAAFFSAAPFVGALAAMPLLGERLSFTQLAAMAAMAAGVVLLARERHVHVHAHPAIEHEHAHLHDEHHRHDHAPGMEVAPGRAHAHLHVHEPTTHEHPHMSDIHHRHGHSS
jgi:drug/metabolite transporter (DMT)-like permease